MDCDHFCLFREELTGGHSNFITGAGGFLQNIIQVRTYGRWASCRWIDFTKSIDQPCMHVQGWAGLRVGADHAMTLHHPTLPPTVHSVKLRALQLGGLEFSVKYDVETITFTLVASLGGPGAMALHIEDGRGGSNLLLHSRGQSVSLPLLSTADGSGVPTTFRLTV